MQPNPVTEVCAEDMLGPGRGNLFQWALLLQGVNAPVPVKDDDANPFFFGVLAGFDS